MKTPKRNINWHGCTDGVDFETYRDTIISQHARWTRKNRDARLRHKIDLLNSQLFLCSWFIERHMGLARKFAEFVKETPVECCQGEKLIETRYFSVIRRDIEGS